MHEKHPADSVPCRLSYHSVMASNFGNTLSKRERKKMTEMGKKGAEKRGVGLGSRQDFVLPSLWSTEVQSSGSQDKLEFVSPRKSRYKNRQQVKATLARLCGEIYGLLQQRRWS